MIVSSYYKTNFLRSISIISIIRVLTNAYIFLSITLIDFLPNIPSIKALLDSDAFLNLIHEKLITTLGLLTQPCAPIYITIANDSTLYHINRIVILKF